MYDGPSVAGNRPDSLAAADSYPDSRLAFIRDFQI